MTDSNTGSGRASPRKYPLPPFGAHQPLRQLLDPGSLDVGWSRLVGDHHVVERLEFHVSARSSLGDVAWVFGPDESYRVGQPQSHPVTDDTPGFPWQKAEVDPDGRLWTLVESNTGTSALRSFGGEAWHTERSDVVAFDLGQDGTVWVNADDRFIRLRDGWRTPQFASEVSDFWMSPVMHETAVPGDEIDDGDCVRTVIRPHRHVVTRAMRS